MPVAYRIPLPVNYRAEFDALDLRHAKQTAIECGCQCGAKYSLITPVDETPENISAYSGHIIATAGGCNQHPGKIRINF